MPGVETAVIAAWAAVAASAVGTGVAAYGAIEQGNAAEDAAKRTQQAENANAQASMNAAALEAGQVRRKNTALTELQAGPESPCRKSRRSHCRRLAHQTWRHQLVESQCAGVDGSRIAGGWAGEAQEPAALRLSTS